MNKVNLGLFSYLKEDVNHLRTFWEAPNLKIKDMESVRLSAFRLQAFGKVLKRALDGKINLGSFIKEQAKVIEDALADCLYIYEMEEMAKKAIQKSKAVQEAKEELLKNQKNYLKLCDGLEGAVKEALFFEDLRAVYLRGLVSEIKKTKTKIETLNPELLEEGTHDLRRKIRWVLMHITYPQGLFFYRDKNADHRGSYIELNSKKEIEPVLISFENIKRLSVFVSKLGKIKDKGLFHQYKNKIKDENTSLPEVVKLTQEIKKEILEDKILKKIRKEIKNGVKNI